MPLEVPILEVDEAPIYQQIAIRACHLEEPGMSRAAIARRLGVDWKTVARALEWIVRALRDAEAATHAWRTPTPYL